MCPLGAVQSAAARMMVADLRQSRGSAELLHFRRSFADHFGHQDAAKALNHLASRGIVSIAASVVRNGAGHEIPLVFLTEGGHHAD